MTDEKEKEKNYQGLGESGILVDKDGNWVDDSWEVHEKPETETPQTETIAQPSLDVDKSDPAYWAFYYDPRYCGPSREAYIERMVKQYAGHPEKSPTTFPSPDTARESGGETAFDEREFDALVDRYAPSPYQHDANDRAYQKNYLDRHAENRRWKLRDWRIALILLCAALLFVFLLFKLMGNA